MMIIGCFITFFMSHQRVCVHVEKKGACFNVTVSGAPAAEKANARTTRKNMTARPDNFEFISIFC
jgi:hypothetical protein